VKTPDHKSSWSHPALPPIRVAADLSGSTVRDIESWIVDGLAYVEMVKEEVYASLDDVMTLAEGGRR
jgi:hypothetical protein